jgi:Lysozyme like domain
LVADNPYAPSDLGGAPVATTTALPIVKPAAPTGAYAPSEIHSALVNAGVPAPAATTLTAISGAESRYGKSTVSGVNKDGSRDYGVFQVNSHAWPQFGGPAVASLPLSQQAAIAAHIYNTQGLKAWSTYNSGAYKGYLNGAADNAPPGGGGAAPAQPAPQPAGVGAALAALNTPTGGPGTKSTAENLSSLAGGGGGGGDAPPPMNLQGQQAAASMGNMRQQQLALQGAQLAAALRAKQGLPAIPGPSSSPTVMGGTVIPMPTAAPTPGAPQPPGTTINSTGALYG